MKNLRDSVSRVFLADLERKFNSQLSGSGAQLRSAAQRLRRAATGTGMPSAPRTIYSGGCSSGCASSAQPRPSMGISEPKRAGPLLPDSGQARFWASQLSPTGHPLTTAHAIALAALKQHAKPRAAEHYHCKELHTKIRILAYIGSNSILFYYQLVCFSSCVSRQHSRGQRAPGTGSYGRPSRPGLGCGRASQFVRKKRKQVRGYAVGAAVLV